MAKTTETPAASQKSDGTLITQNNGQTYVLEVYFNHASKETFQDKLLRIMLAEKLNPKSGVGYAAASMNGRKPAHGGVPP